MQDAVGFPTGPETDESKLAPDAAGSTATTKEKWRDFFPGQKLDICDTVGKWCEAVVADVDDECVFIHYVYFSSKWDERIPKDSPRLAPFRSHIYYDGGVLKVGQRVDVFDRHKTRRRWCRGEIVEANAETVKVHFHGWTSRWDELHSRDSEFIAPYGRHTAIARAYRPKAFNYWRNRTRSRIVVANESKWTQYCKALGGLGLALKQCEGDGNCMFRAVSHQLYGDSSHHALVRRSAIQYMRIHREWFQPFVAYSMSSFDDYLKYKAMDGVWGDDPEIQAICELYNRAAHLYVYHPKKGATKLRTFHAVDGDERPSLRLSYYGGGHYDSVISISGATEHLRTAPGVAEAAALAAAVESVRTAGATRPEGKAEERGGAVSATTRASREQFDANDENVEDAMVRQMSSASDTEATQDEIVKQVLKLSAENDLKQLEEAEVEEAKVASAAAAGVGDDDRAIFAAMAASEAEQLAKVEADSLAAALAASRETAGFDASAATQDEGMGVDADLAEVLARSRAEADATNAAIPDDSDLADVLAMSRVEAGVGDDDEDMLAAALAASAGEADTIMLPEEMDPEVQRALAMSMNT